MNKNTTEHNDLLDTSLRVHAKKITDYILRGNGRRLVPKEIYHAAWQIHFALASNAHVRDGTLATNAEPVVRREGYHFCNKHQQEFLQYCSGCALDLPTADKK